MNDRIIGYTVIVSILLLLVLPIGYLIWQTSVPRTTRTIIFKDVQGLSFLSYQDPVRVRGVEVGLVKSITYHENSAHVTIETDRNIKIFEGYTVEVLAKGVMGERFLTITTGNASQKILPPDEPLFGRVAVGPDEALSYIGKLLHEVRTLTTLSHQLRYGTQEKNSLIIMTWQITRQINTIVSRLQQVLTSADTSVADGLATISDILEHTNKFTSMAVDSLDGTMIAIDSLMANLETLLTKTESLLLQTTSVTSAFSNPNLFLWKTPKDSLLLRLKKLQDLIGTLNSDSITLPVRLW